jgi:hypothetical protein
MLRYGSERGAVLPHSQQACSAKPDSTKMLFAFRIPTNTKPLVQRQGLHICASRMVAGNFSVCSSVNCF